MRPTLRNALRLASVPVGVGVGLWTAGMSVTIRPPSSSSCAAFWLCSPGPRFAPWQCALFGVAAAIGVLLMSFETSAMNVLRTASVPAGVLIGLWTAFLRSAPGCPNPNFCPNQVELQVFSPWLCVLFGVGAGVVLLLLSFAVAGLSSARPLKAA
jgi:hypothetical protein